MFVTQILHNNSHRKLKFSISLSILLSLSYYSYHYGKTELSLIDRVENSKFDISSFPYLKVIGYRNDVVVFKDQWNS